MGLKEELARQARMVREEKAKCLQDAAAAEAKKVRDRCLAYATQLLKHCEDSAKLGHDSANIEVDSDYTNKYWENLLIAFTAVGMHGFEFSFGSDDGFKFYVYANFGEK